MMTTGDLKNNLKTLQAEIKLVKYPESIDLASLSKGIPTAFLPIYHYAFTSYDANFTKELSDMNIELYGKSDLRFMEGIYKILRDVFHFKPSISKEQFFSQTSFVEQKIIMCTKILQFVRNRCKNTKFRVPRPKTVDHKNSAPLGNRQIPKSKSSQFHPTSARKTMRASGSNQSLMLPLEPPRLVKNQLNSSESDLTSCKQAWAYTPSIKKVNPAAVVVVNIPKKDEHTEITLNDSQMEMVDIIASTPSASILGQPQNNDRAQMEDQMLKALKELTNRVVLLEEQSEQQLCCRGCQGIKQQLILLQNEVTLMKANNVSVPPISVSKSPSADVYNDSLSGSIISVEGVVNGESKVQRMARAAEAKIRSVSDSDSLATIFSPIKPFDKSNGHFSTASPDFMLQNQASPDPRRSSTPTNVAKINHDFEMKTESDLPVDVSTIEKINRIQQMFSETEAMLPKPEALS